MPRGTRGDRVERNRAFMARLDGEAKACFLRCIRGGLTGMEARAIAADDMMIRMRVARGKKIEFRATRP